MKIIKQEIQFEESLKQLEKEKTKQMKINT